MITVILALFRKWIEFESQNACVIKVRGCAEILPKYEFANYEWWGRSRLRCHCADFLGAPYLLHGIVLTHIGGWHFMDLSQSLLFFCLFLICLSLFAKQFLSVCPSIPWQCSGSSGSYDGFLLTGQPTIFSTLTARIVLHFIFRSKYYLD